MANKNHVIKRMFEGFDYLENMLNEAVKFPEGTTSLYHRDTLEEIDDIFWSHQVLLQRVIESTPDVVMAELEKQRPDFISFIGVCGADPEWWNVKKIIATDDAYKFIFKFRHPKGFTEVTVDIRYYKDPMWFIHSWVNDVCAWTVHQGFSANVSGEVIRWRDAWKVCLR